MRYGMLAFRLELGRCLRRRRFWAFVLLAAAAAAALRLVPWGGETGMVTVGVVLPQGEGGDLWPRLEARSGELVTFRLAEEEELLRAVSTSRWDCGLVVEEDFDRLLEEGEYEGLITLVTGPGSTVYPLVRETVAAVLLELAAPGIARDYVTQRLGADGAELEAALPRLEEILPQDQRVAVELETADGRAMAPLELAGAGTEQMVRGTAAVLLLVWALSAGVDLGRWKESGQGARLLAVRGTWAALLPRLTARLVPVLLVSGAALLAATGSWAGTAMLAPYLLALGGLALLLTRGRLWRALPVLLPFAGAAGLLLSPVFLDITALLPGLAPLCGVLPVTLYLESCGGDAAAVGKLTGMALALGLLAGAPWEALARGRSAGQPAE